MTGHETTKRLSSYLDEQLDERQTRQVAAHLSGCRRCRSQLEGLRRVAADLRALARSKAPAGLGLRLQQRLAREAPPPFGEGSVGRRFPVFFVRPVILVAAGVIIALNPHPSHRPESPPADLNRLRLDLQSARADTEGRSTTSLLFQLLHEEHHKDPESDDHPR